MRDATTTPNFTSGMPVSVQNLDNVTTEERHELGTEVRDNYGNTFVYVKSAGAIAQSVPVAITSALVASASGNGGVVDGICYSTFTAANEYGWVLVRGDIVCEVATGISSADILQKVADANGDLFAVTAAGEACCAVALANESGGQAVCRLY